MKQHELEAYQNQVWESFWASAQEKVLDQLERETQREVRARVYNQIQAQLGSRVRIPIIEGLWRRWKDVYPLKKAFV